MSCLESDRFNRREFLAAAASGSVAAMAGINTPPLRADDKSASETLVTQLHQSLTPEQKSTVSFPFDHPLRSNVDANWHITPARIGQSFTGDQQAMIREIFSGLHNPEFVGNVFRHLDDDGGGLANYSVALFGEPGTGAFEFVLTGRHCTVRCDGDSVEGAAFGGPIFYGHASGGFNEKPDHPGNVYWYQAKRANEVFQALSGKQRELALLADPRAERGTDTVQLKTDKQAMAGLPIGDMSRDQRKLVEQVLGDLLLPFRKKDSDEALNYIRANGGVDALVMSFYKNLDVGNDGVWDVWQLESPRMVWYFRGSPHVHTWVNIRG
jgi:hypothetical protein